MTTEYKTQGDKTGLLKMLIGGVCNNLGDNDVEFQKSGSSGGLGYETFKSLMLRANFGRVTDNGKRKLARDAMQYWQPSMARVQTLGDYVTLLQSALALFDDESKKNDVWIYPHRATRLQSRPPGPQRSEFAEVNTHVTERNSDKVELLLNRMRELQENA
jgi:hypothetical protein